MPALAETFERLCSLLSHLRDVGMLQELLSEALGYTWTDDVLTVEQPLDGFKEILAGNPRIVAEGGSDERFQIIYIPLCVDALDAASERAIAVQLLDKHPYALFVFTNSRREEWHFLNIRNEPEGFDRRLMRRLTITPPHVAPATVQRFARLAIDEIAAAKEKTPETVSPSDIQVAHDEVFDAESLSQAFYSDFLQVFSSLKIDLRDQSGDERWAHRYALLFLTRCLFLYFIQGSGWLGGDPAFMRTFWNAYEQAGKRKDTFVNQWLWSLFFDTISQSTPPSNTLPEAIQTALQSVPFLSTTLFQPDGLDEQFRSCSAMISDARFQNVFAFLESHDFSVVEDSALFQEVAIDPGIIGTIHESLANASSTSDERGGAGIFYTPRTEIDLMCRLSLVDYLANHLGARYKELLYDLVFATAPEEKQRVDAHRIAPVLWRHIRTLLEEVTVVDPACGAGSFLVGMLDVLDDLLERAHRQLGVETSRFTRRARLLEQNLYGVDVISWATTATRLRLWLAVLSRADKPLDKLTADKNGRPLLPDLSHTIRTGDAIVQRPAEDQPEEALEQASEHARDAYRWTTAFPEVFHREDSGFDIVIGNPPYVRQEDITNPLQNPEAVGREDRIRYKSKLAEAVYRAFPSFFDYDSTRGKAVYPLSKKSDLFVYFYFYGLRLLNRKGVLCFVTSNSWLDVGYGARLQEFLLRKTHIKLIIDSERRRSFADAEVNTVITLLSAPHRDVDETLSETTRFVVLHHPFDQALRGGLWADLERKRTPASCGAYRLYAARQSTLLKAGAPIQEQLSLSAPNGLPSRCDYAGDKWGGKYLRASGVYWTIMEKAGQSLRALGMLTDIRYGIKTGANRFFYLAEQDAEKWGIETKYLIPVIKSPRECRTIRVQEDNLQYHLFFCQENRQKLEDTAALEYICWGEREGFHTNYSVQGRRCWWHVPYTSGNAVFVKEANNTSAVFLNPERLPVDCRLYAADLPPTALLFLNSVFAALFFEVYNRSGLGGGARSLMVSDYRSVPCYAREDETGAARQLLKEIAAYPPRRVTSFESHERWEAVDTCMGDLMGLSPQDVEEAIRVARRLAANRLAKADSL